MTLRHWLGQLPSWIKVVAASGVLFTTGATAGSALAGYARLPAAVANNTARLAVLERNLEELSQLIELQVCLDLADRRQIDWRSCLTRREP